MILGEIGRVERAVQRLLDFSRPSASIRHPVDLADCVRTAVPSVRGLGDPLAGQQDFRILHPANWSAVPGSIGVSPGFRIVPGGAGGGATSPLPGTAIIGSGGLNRLRNNIRLIAEAGA